MPHWTQNPPFLIAVVAAGSRSNPWALQATMQRCRSCFCRAELAPWTAVCLRHFSSSISSTYPHTERANEVSVNPNQTSHFPGALRDHMIDWRDFIMAERKKNIPSPRKRHYLQLSHVKKVAACAFSEPPGSLELKCQLMRKSQNTETWHEDITALILHRIRLFKFDEIEGKIKHTHEKTPGYITSAVP